MQSSFPRSVESIISDCVGAVSQRILAQLIDANPKINSLSFMFGHPLELKNLIMKKGEARATKYDRFPVVMLFSDIVGGASSVRGGFQDVTLNMVIAMTTDPSFIASQRTATNFDPILRPIYQELIQEIWRCGQFHIQSVRSIMGRDIERYFWGREGIQGGSASPMNDCIDAIEIKGLRVTQTRPGNSIYQNTFMQLVEYFLTQTRMTITVGSVVADTITNTFFLQTISEIDTNGQVYIVGTDFTQTLDGGGNPTGAIVGVNIEFFTGQVLIAKR